MRKASAPAANRLAMTLRSEEAGPSVATTLVRRRRRIVSASWRRRRHARTSPSRRGLQHWHPRLQRLHGHLVRRFRQLDGPGRLVAGIDFEEAGTVITAGETVFGAADREFLLARAHKGLPGPFAAAVVIDRIDIIEARHQ